MITIISRGKVKKAIFEVICPCCDSVLQYESEDVNKDRDGSYIKCPVYDMFISHTF